MKILPQAERYYLFGFEKAKTHLLYFTPYPNYRGYITHLACMPNLPIEVQVGSQCEYYTEECTLESANIIDSYYGELTCPTCMKIAQGEPQGVLNLIPSGQ